MANENEPTPPVLPKIFQLNGQIGHLQADQAEQAEEFEKESEFEYWTDNLSHEMKAIQNFVSTIGAMDKKKIEGRPPHSGSAATSCEYAKMGFSRLPEWKGIKEVPT